MLKTIPIPPTPPRIAPESDEKETDQQRKLIFSEITAIYNALAKGGVEAAISLSEGTLKIESKTESQREIS